MPSSVLDYSAWLLLQDSKCSAACICQYLHVKKVQAATGLDADPTDGCHSCSISVLLSSSYHPTALFLTATVLLPSCGVHPWLASSTAVFALACNAYKRLDPWTWNIFSSLRVCLRSRGMISIKDWQREGVMEFVLMCCLSFRLLDTIWWTMPHICGVPSLCTLLV